MHSAMRAATPAHGLLHGRCSMRTTATGSAQHRTCWLCSKGEVVLGQPCAWRCCLHAQQLDRHFPSRHQPCSLHCLWSMHVAWHASGALPKATSVMACIMAACHVRDSACMRDGAFPPSHEFPQSAAASTPCCLGALPTSHIPRYTQHITQHHLCACASLPVRVPAAPSWER